MITMFILLCELAVKFDISAQRIRQIKSLGLARTKKVYREAKHFLKLAAYEPCPMLFHEPGRS